MNGRILVLQHDGLDHEHLLSSLLAAGLKPANIKKPEDIDKLLAEPATAGDIIVADITFFTESTDALKTVKEQFYDVPLILIATPDTIDTAIEYTKESADGYLVNGYFDTLLLKNTIIAALKSKEKQQDINYNEFFKESPIPMWVLNPVSLTFMDVNPALLELYGYTREEFLKLTLPQIRFDKRDVQQLMNARPESGFHNAGYTSHLRKDGTVLHVKIYSQAITYKGKKARLTLVIDERKNYQAELHNKELNDIIKSQKEDLDDMLSTITDVIWSASAHNFSLIYINDAALKVFGKKPEEMIGTPVFVNNLFEEDADKIKIAIQELFTQGKTRIEYRIVHTNGDIKYLINEATLKRDEWGNPSVINGITSDVTSMRLIQKELKKKAFEVESILESIRDGFFALNKNWEFTYVNKAFEKIYGWKREQVIGLNYWDKFPNAKNSQFYVQYHKALKEQVDVHFEEFASSLNKWVSVSVYPTNEGLTVYFIDITKEKEHRLRIRMQNEKLREIAWIQSHKVRGPLATIMGLANIFEKEDLSDPSNLFIMNGIREASDELDAVIREIVDKTRSVDDMNV